MKSWLTHLWSHRRLATRLAQATLLLGAVVGGGAAVAAPALRSGGTEVSPHQCQCGKNCQGRSCCCSGKPTPAQPPASARRPTAAATTVPADSLATSPCFKAAPCGESGRSSSSMPGPVGRAALLGRLEPLFAATSRRLNLKSTRTTLPSRRVDRLDDPPEPRIGG